MSNIIKDTAIHKMYDTIAKGPKHDKYENILTKFIPRKTNNPITAEIPITYFQTVFACSDTEITSL